MPKKANIFESFSHSAIQQFKEAFGIMDADKDGLLSASDLVAAFGAHGKSIGSGDAQVKRNSSFRIPNISKSSTDYWNAEMRIFIRDKCCSLKYLDILSLNN